MSDRKNSDQSNRPTKSATKGKRRRRSESLDAKKLVDEAFSRPVKIKFRGKFQTISTFAAIIFQLTTKALTDRRALRVLGRYRAYAAASSRRRVHIVFDPEGGSGETP